MTQLDYIDIITQLLLITVLRYLALFNFASGFIYAYQTQSIDIALHSHRGVHFGMVVSPGHPWYTEVVGIQGTFASYLWDGVVVRRWGHPYLQRNVCGVNRSRQYSLSLPPSQSLKTSISHIIYIWAFVLCLWEFRPKLRFKSLHW